MQLQDANMICTNLNEKIGIITSVAKMRRGLIEYGAEGGIDGR